VGALAVSDLDLDLDAFEGPFDLLLTLVLKEELALSDVEIAEIVATFVQRLADEGREGSAGGGLGSAGLQVCGEFLVLVAALLELKARDLLADDEELDLEELDPDEAAAELAERLAEYRRVRAGAAWLEERLGAEAERYFRLGPAPLAPALVRPLAPQDPASLAAAIRSLAQEPPAPSLAHLALRLPPLHLFVERFRAALRRRRAFVFDEEVGGLSRLEVAVAFLALLDLRRTGEALLEQAMPFEPITVTAAGRR
jgi:segregation and condensation protein A